MANLMSQWCVMVGLPCSLAPCHPAARPYVEPPQSVVATTLLLILCQRWMRRRQWARRPEKGEECIGPPCRLLSHAHPTRGGQLGLSNCCHFHPPLKEVPENTSKRGAWSHRRRHRVGLRQAQAGRRHGSAHASRSVVGLRSRWGATSRCSEILTIDSSYRRVLLCFINPTVRKQSNFPNWGLQLPWDLLQNSSLLLCR